MCEELQEMTLFRRKKGPYSNLQVKKIPSAAVLQLDENKVAQQVVQTQDQRSQQWPNDFHYNYFALI